MALWAAVAALTLLHSATLVLALGASQLSLACAALFVWTALLGCGGAARGLTAAAPGRALAADAHGEQLASSLRVGHIFIQSRFENMAFAPSEQRALPVGAVSLGSLLAPSHQRQWPTGHSVCLGPAGQATRDPPGLFTVANNHA